MPGRAVERLDPKKSSRAGLAGVLLQLLLEIVGRCPDMGLESLPVAAHDVPIYHRRPAVGRGRRQAVGDTAGRGVVLVGTANGPVSYTHLDVYKRQGCIRMRNDDVTDLYDRVKIGTKVIVI